MQSDEVEKTIKDKVSVGGLHLPKVLKNTTNMLSKYNILGTFGFEMKVCTT